MSKILIIGPNLDSFGGVAFLLKSLKDNQLFLEEDYFECGNKKNILGHFIDLIKFFKKFKNYDVIHLNPSFEYKSILRDLLLVGISLGYSKKVIISWMGWNEGVEKRFLDSKILKYVLLKIIDRKSVINIVSNDGFIKKFKQIGVRHKIEVIFPPYDTYLDNFIFEPKMINNKNKLRILFLARIEKSKGIDKLIEIFELLNNDLKFEFIIAGDGAELKRLKALAKQKKINITFTGFIQGKEKVDLFKNSDLFIFPSHHAEGVPLILVEAMYAGMFLIVSDAGGIPFVINQNNGFVLNKFSTAKEFYDSIKALNSVEFNKISEYNINYAKEYFNSKVIINKYNKLYESLINGI